MNRGRQARARPGELAGRPRLWPGRNACREPARAIPLMAHALVLSFAQRTRLPACRRHPGVSSSFPATRPGAFPWEPGYDERLRHLRRPPWEPRELAGDHRV